MKERSKIIDCLVKSPELLSDLIAGIPPEILKKRRIQNKWTIHEHACHLPEAEQMIIDRFNVFKNENHPVFEIYLPGTTVSDDHLLETDLNEALNRFKFLRNSLIDLVHSFDTKVWSKKAIHPEYESYNAYILLRHTLMHDHFHMYRIEELWLTKDAFIRT